MLLEMQPSPAFPLHLLQLGPPASFRVQSSLGIMEKQVVWVEGALSLGDAGEGAPLTTYIPSSKGPRGWVLPGHFVLCRLQESLCNRGGVRGAPAWGVRQGEARAHACGYSTRHPRVNLSGKCGVRTQASRVIYGCQGPCPIDMALQARPHLFRTCWTLPRQSVGRRFMVISSRGGTVGRRVLQPSWASPA